MSTALSLLVIVVLLGGAAGVWHLRDRRPPMPTSAVLWALLVASLIGSIAGGDEPIAVVAFVVAVVTVAALAVRAASKPSESETRRWLGCGGRVAAAAVALVALPITYFLLLGAQLCESGCETFHDLAGVSGFVFLAAVLLLLGLLIEALARVALWLLR